MAGASWALPGSVGRPSAASGSPAPTLAELHRLPPASALLHTWTAADERIERATQQLVVSCMARRGFRYDPGPPPVQDVDSGAAPFGLESLDPPKRPPPPPPEQPETRDERFGRALRGDPEQRITARGVQMSVSRPGSGCLADAEQRLLGDQRVRWLQLKILLYEAERASRDRLEKDAEFRAVTDRWVGCMRQAKVVAPDPVRLLGSLPQDVDIRSHPITAADVHCKEVTGYLPVAYRRLAAAQRATLDADPSVRSDWNRLLAQQDAEASRVLNPR